MRDARAAIGNFHLNHILLPTRRDADLNTGPGVLRCVFDQVGENLIDFDVVK